jgi:hypothetical protein
VRSRLAVLVLYDNPTDPLACARYYTGAATAPLLTIVIGGNHEASNVFQELYHGGWIAPNIYFLGHAGCVRINGVRVAGASGIFNPAHFRLGMIYAHLYMRDN